MRRTIPFVAALLWAMPLQAAEPHSVSTMWQVDCGQWVTGRAEARSLPNERFVIGLLDGLSLGHFVEFWKANGASTSPDAVFLWLDNYCKAHPLDNLDHAVVALYMKRSGWKG